MLSSKKWDDNKIPANDDTASLSHLRRLSSRYRREGLWSQYRIEGRGYKVNAGLWGYKGYKMGAYPLFIQKK